MTNLYSSADCLKRMQSIPAKAWVHISTPASRGAKSRSLWVRGYQVNNLISPLVLAGNARKPVLMSHGTVINGVNPPKHEAKMPCFWIHFPPCGDIVRVNVVAGFYHRATGQITPK